MLTVGEILKKEREIKGFSLTEIEKEIKIREKFLQAVEDNNWQNFSSKIYIVGIIRNYAKFLGISPQKAIAYFYRDFERIEEVRFKRKIPSQYLTSQTRKAFFAFIASIFVIFFIYFGLQLKNYFSPPKVTIISPNTKVIKKGDSVKIVGRTDKDAVITVARERVFQNEQGIFEFKHQLIPGKNTVTVEVVGANGKKTLIKRDYFLQTKSKD